MTIGEKLKKLRQLRGMTQHDLAGEKISRNMICQIERGTGNPSLTVMRYLAQKLHVDPGYFLTEEDDLAKYLISASLPAIRDAFKKGYLRECIQLCQPFTEEECDELMLILATCYCRCGEENYEIGYLESARSDFLLARQYAERSLYSASLQMKIEYFLTLLDESAPFVRFYKLRVSEDVRHIHESFLYRQILDLIASGNAETAGNVLELLTLETLHYRRHISARVLMAHQEYDRAMALLHEIVRDRDKNGIDVPFLMQVYRDLELCCKALGDYEGAYRCAKQLLAFSENMHH